MRRYVLPLIVLLAMSTLSFAQGFVLQSAGELVSISKTQVVLNYQEKDHVFKIDKDTELLDDNGKKISITDFKKGENVKVTSEIDSKVAKEVKKGFIEINLASSAVAGELEDKLIEAARNSHADPVRALLELAGKNWTET